MPSRRRRRQRQRGRAPTARSGSGSGPSFGAGRGAGGLGAGERAAGRRRGLAGGATAQKVRARAGNRTWGRRTRCPSLRVLEYETPGRAAAASKLRQGLRPRSVAPGFKADTALKPGLRAATAICRHGVPDGPRAEALAEISL